MKDFTNFIKNFKDGNTIYNSEDKVQYYFEIFFQKYIAYNIYELLRKNKEDEERFFSIVPENLLFIVCCFSSTFPIYPINIPLLNTLLYLEVCHLFF